MGWGGGIRVFSEKYVANRLRKASYYILDVKTCFRILAGLRLVSGISLPADFRDLGYTPRYPGVRLPLENRNRREMVAGLRPFSI